MPIPCFGGATAGLAPVLPSVAMLTASTRSTMLSAMKSRRILRAAGSIAMALALRASPVDAQTKEPEKPADFKAMETPGAPATLTTPSTSLITPATGVANPPPGFTGSKIVMTQQVWGEYVKYLRNDIALGYGLFMITVDGRAYHAMECKNYACQISPVTRTTALDQCQSIQKRRCIVFAEGRDIKYAYQVVP
jgi:hypothetical protein